MREDHSVPDALLGAAWLAAGQFGRAGHLVLRVTRPGARLVLEPKFIPSSRRPARLVESLVRRGRMERASASRTLDQLVAVGVPALVAHLITLVPLTELVRRSLDLDALVADVDVDAVAAGIDIDAIAARVDIASVLDRLDLTALVMTRVDLDAVVSTVDIDAIIARLDLVAIANEVIAAIDLPEIIRESSGSLASESVRSVRMQSIDADRAVERLVERFIRHRRRGPGDPLPGSTST